MRITPILPYCGRLTETGATEHAGVASATHGVVTFTLHPGAAHGHLAQVVAVRAVDLRTPDAVACYLDGVARSVRKLANACRRGVNIPLEDWRAAGDDTTTHEASA